MKRISILVAAILGSYPARVSVQEERSPILYSLQEETPRAPGRAPEPDLPSTWEERSDDLWYGTPGVRPGGDLLGPMIDLVRKPWGLLDFSPRKVPSYLPDRESAEFLRERP